MINSILKNYNNIISLLLQLLYQHSRMSNIFTTKKTQVKKIEKTKNPKQHNEKKELISTSSRYSIQHQDPQVTESK